METDKRELRQQVEAKILAHAEGSLINLGGSLVTYVLGFINGHRQEWYDTGYSIGYMDARAEWGIVDEDRGSEDGNDEAALSPVH